MAKRKALGKRIRFEIFKRDSFTCQYCGNRPPDVLLVIDHIQPVSLGGDNDILNLITSCESCNQGKSNKELGKIIPRPDADIEWLEMQQEIVELRRYQLAKQERDALIDKIVGLLQNTWGEQFEDEYVPADAVLKRWLTWAAPDQIEDAIKVAASQSYRIKSFHNRLKYCAGVLHNMTGTRKVGEDDI